MAAEACCTCATLLSDTKVPYDPDSEKPLVLDRRLPCCSRTICATCQYRNPRFQDYCPFCQISSAPSALPSNGLRLPPSYATSSAKHNLREPEPDLPPSYDSLDSHPIRTTQPPQPPSDTPDTVHHLSSLDTFPSLSLLYSVPVPILKSHNNIPSDMLLAGHKFLLIPSSHYTGPPLSTPPDPVEEEKKNKLRRWMVATKCAEYSVAQLYLKGSEWDLEGAVEAFRADEKWERENPMRGNGKEKEGGMERRRRLGGSGSLVGQIG